MSSVVADLDRRERLRATYSAFNGRDIEAALAQMTDDVDWPNAWEGGRVVGHDAVREYWTRQWSEIDPTVEPLDLSERADGTIAVDVHQVVRSHDGALLDEGRVAHVYAFRGGLVARMDVEEGSRMSEQIRDPVSRVRYAFEPQGEDLIVYTWLEPGGGLPAHFHPRQEERWSVLEGQVRFRLGEEKRVIAPDDGETLVAPGVAHGLWSVSDREARLHTVVTPALRLQAFLEESAAAAREGLFTARGLPRGVRGARWAANFLKRYEDETVFLSPPRPVQRVLFALLARDT
jgi:quercetin dioxygenase-like cupin family protein